MRNRMSKAFGAVRLARETRDPPIVAAVTVRPAPFAFSRHPRAPERHPRARPEDLSTRQGIQKSGTASGPADPRVKPEDDVRGLEDDVRGLRMTFGERFSPSLAFS